VFQAQAANVEGSRQQDSDCRQDDARAGVLSSREGYVVIKKREGEWIFQE